VPTPAPIVCTLGAGDYQTRINWISALTQRALRSYRREDLVLHLSYIQEARENVRELVQKEQACCPFLTFELREGADDIEVSITAPEEARSAAESLFEQFVASALNSTVCSCC
jgi:hypothetical protein